MVFASLLLASNVQRWIRDVQKCSSLNQLWPEMSKLKSAGSALNIAENAKISESALKMTEYLWEINPGKTSSTFLTFRTNKLSDFLQNLSLGEKIAFFKKHHLIRILQQNCHRRRFWKKWVFFKENIGFSKNPRCVHNWKMKSFYFSPILRQICYNLEMRKVQIRDIRNFSIGK